MSMATRLEGPADGPAVWLAADFVDDHSWLYQFGAGEVGEIETALALALASGKPITGIERADFPLPTVAPRLREAVAAVEHGRGFALLRGIMLPNYSRHEARLLFWGLGQYIGVPIYQNPQGALLHEIEDLSNDYAANNVRGHSTNARLRPHVDPCDIVGLLCIHPAREGGQWHSLNEIGHSLSVRVLGW